MTAITNIADREQGSSVRTKLNTVIDDRNTLDPVTGVARTDTAQTFTGDQTVTGNIIVTGTVDGRDVATDGTKLDGVEALADVTDATNVTAAGALMDSEVTNLAQVKAFDQTDYATAAQGATADAALPKVGGALTGAVTTTSTFDGRDVAADGVTADAALPKAGGAMTGAITTTSTFDGRDVAADGVTADAALPKAGGAMTGAITTTSTFDGRDVAADGVTADAALPRSGGAMTGAITTNSTFDGRDVAADGITADAALSRSGGAMTGIITNFASTGIDDNATGEVITLTNNTVTGPAVFRIQSTEGTRGSVQISGPNDATTRAVTYGNNFWKDDLGAYVQASAAIGGSLIEMTATNAAYGGFIFKAKQDPGSGGAVADRMTIDAAGDVTIGQGSLIIGTAGEGVDFSATADGSGTTTSEVLDDYEEGTFTPTILFGGTDTGAVYTSQVGRYVKIGRIVNITVNVITSTKSSDTGNATIGGLPFAGTQIYAQSMRISNVTFQKVPEARVTSGSSVITLSEVNNAGGTSTLTNADFAANSNLTITGIYETTA
tara:strand:+ start:3093 stop:4745 length:1653 start_codon:yes stop_codon:yes gene_type:complete